MKLFGVIDSNIEIFFCEKKHWKKKKKYYPWELNLGAKTLHPQNYWSRMFKVRSCSGGRVKTFWFWFRLN